MNVGVLFWSGDMQYKKQYDILIERARVRGSPVGYREQHHIVPRCIGGGDEKENLVYLTAKEHYVAHHLLYMHYKTPQLAYAWFSMTWRSDNQERHITSNQYERAKRVMAEAARERIIKSNPMDVPMYRQKVINHLLSAENQKRIRETSNTPEAKQKKSLTMQRWCSTEEGKIYHRKRVENIKGIPRTEEVRLKCSVTQRGKPKPKVQCLVCGVYVDVGNLKRWHKH